MTTTSDSEAVSATDEATDAHARCAEVSAKSKNCSTLWSGRWANCSPTLRRVDASRNLCLFVVPRAV